MASLDQLKSKYASVLQLIKEQNVVLSHLHEQDGKLFAQGKAPNEEIKNKVWNAIKAVDPSFSDLTVDIGVDSSIPLPAQKYEVRAGDSLSIIAKAFYGDPMMYTKIFEANRDKISDPNLIHPGQVLVIPPQ